MTQNLVWVFSYHHWCTHWSTRVTITLGKSLVQRHTPRGKVRPEVDHEWVGSRLLLKRVKKSLADKQLIQHTCIQYSQQSYFAVQMGYSFGESVGHGYDPERWDQIISSWANYLKHLFSILTMEVLGWANGLSIWRTCWFCIWPWSMWENH